MRTLLIALVLAASAAHAQAPEVVACQFAPTTLQVVPTATPPVVIRRDDVFLVAANRCVALVTLEGRDRWAVRWPPCAGAAWRRHPATYAARAAAIDRARRVPACPLDSRS